MYPMMHESLKSAVTQKCVKRPLIFSRYECPMSVGKFNMLISALGGFLLT